MKVHIYAILAMLMMTPWAANAGCVPDQSTIKFSCGTGVSGNTPASKTIKYGAVASASFSYSYCTAPSGKTYGGYIIHVDDGSAPDVEIAGSSNSFNYYYTSDITIMPRWISSTIDSDSIRRIADNPQFYNNGSTNLSDEFRGGVRFSFYNGTVIVNYKVGDTTYPPNITPGFIMPDDYTPPTQTSSSYGKFCYCQLDTVDDITSPWVYAGKVTSTNAYCSTLGSCCYLCTDLTKKNFRSLAVRFLGE